MVFDVVIVSRPTSLTSVTITGVFIEFDTVPEMVNNLPGNGLTLTLVVSWSTIVSTIPASSTRAVSR